MSRLGLRFELRGAGSIKDRARGLRRKMKRVAQDDDAARRIVMLSLALRAALAGGDARQIVDFTRDDEQACIALLQLAEVVKKVRGSDLLPPDSRKRK